jgi:aryl-alcohol dehydrogenase-like predicted oxidoreductase
VKYRSLGRSGLVVSELGLGANNFGGRLDESQSTAVIHEALDLGVNLIDTADIYNAGRSEEIVGRAIVGRRDEVVIATKVGLPCEEGEHGGGLGARHLRRIVHRSLQRLGVDHLDLLQLHIPDPWTPIEETLDALDRLVRAGDILYVGSTNFFAWEVALWTTLARERGRPAIVAASSEWSLLHREPERELVGAAQEVGVGVMPFRPLAQGFLTGKYRQGQAPSAGSRFDLVPQQARDRLSAENFEVLERVQSVAADEDVDVAAIALGYLLSHDVVSSVLVGASSPEQVRDLVRWTSTDVSDELLHRVGGELSELCGHRLGRPELRPVDPRQRPRP